MESRSSLNILNEKMTKKLNILDQKIMMQDIVVRQVSFANGELLFNSIHDEKNSLQRIIDHIKLLARLTNQYHENEHCEQQNTGIKIKPAHVNFITRMITHEFSFYPKEHPLTVVEFNQLISAIAEIGKQLHENVHLIISSIPVGVSRQVEKIEEIVVSNHVVHLQGGAEPKIDVFTKFNTHVFDHFYMNASIEGVKTYKKGDNLAEQQQGKIDLLISDKDEKIAMNYRNIANCQTIGGARFYTVVDVCLDFKKKVGALSYQRILNDAFPTDIIPKYVSHVVTSNSTDFQGEKLTSEIVKADPKTDYSLREQKPIVLLQSFVKLCEGLLNEFKEYKDMNVCLNEGGLFITYPPFGKNIHLHIYPQYELGLGNTTHTFTKNWNAAFYQHKQNLFGVFCENKNIEEKVQTPKNKNSL